MAGVSGTAGVSGCVGHGARSGERVGRRTEGRKGWAGRRPREGAGGGGGGGGGGAGLRRGSAIVTHRSRNPCNPSRPEETRRRAQRSATNRSATNRSAAGNDRSVGTGVANGANVGSRLTVGSDHQGELWTALPSLELARVDRHACDALALDESTIGRAHELGLTAEGLDGYAGRLGVLGDCPPDNVVGAAYFWAPERMRDGCGWPP